MDIGLDQLVRSLLTLNSQLAVVSNNIANTSTDRYKTDTLTIRSFSDYYVQELYGSEKENLFDLNSCTDFTQGEMYESDINDIALDKNGFIQVMYKDNLYYSRGGSFDIGTDGYLVDQHGAYIMGTQGRIYAADQDVEISEAGTVTVAGTYADTIETVDFADYTELQKIGFDYYAASENAVTVESQAKIKQGYSEGSNVSITEEYLKMMDISNKYETSQAVIQILDEMNGKTVNTIAAF